MQSQAKQKNILNEWHAQARMSYIIIQSTGMSITKEQKRERNRYL